MKKKTNLALLFCPKCKNAVTRVAIYENDGQYFTGNQLSCKKCNWKTFERNNEDVYLKVQSLRTRLYQNFLRAARIWKDKFEHAFQDALGDPTATFYQPTTENLARLYNFKLLTLQHKISVSELVAIILKLRYSRTQGAKSILHILGLSTIQFGGPGFLAKIDEAIKLRYPAREHLKSWRAAERQHQLIQLVGTDQTGNYSERMKRLEAGRKILEHATKQRPYRDNPWR